MSTITVTTTDADGPTGTVSLAAAIARANASPEDDVIRFDAGRSDGPMVVSVAGTLEVLAAGGALTIKGDRDGDGVSDVVLSSSGTHHMTVQTGARVTLQNLDLIGGRGTGDDGRDGQAGEAGAYGGQQAGLDGLDGLDGTATATEGQAGDDGLAGEDAAGAILNYGELTLERVGFGLNSARGGMGGVGGLGGNGGGGQRGADGLTGTDVRDGNVAMMSRQRVELSQAFAREGIDADPGDDILNDYVLVDGGDGGDGGDGADGGAGGAGGDGGAAAGAILNADGADLTLRDVTFGGILSSGVLGGGNSAYGGLAGAGGRGGEGGAGGAGGEGGEPDVAVMRLWRMEFAQDGFTQLDFHLDVHVSAPGRGGDGGTGGAGGMGGADGDGGAAATLINRGTVEGRAALPAGARTENEASLINNLAQGGEMFDGGVAGTRGGEGQRGSGGFEYANWVSERDIYVGDSPASATTAELDAFTADLIAWRMALHERLDMKPVGYWPSQEVLGPPGVNGAAGAAGTAGPDGRRGSADTALLNDDGQADVESAASLVYLHDRGIVDDALAFTIIRTGDTSQPLTVSWSVTGDGPRPVSGSDFAGPISGSVTFEARTVTLDELLTPTFDRDASVAAVEIGVVGGATGRPAEGYRIEIFGLSGERTLLGTSSVAGTIGDASVAPPDPIAGTDRPERLPGTVEADRILGLAGGDELLGFGGDDTLEGGEGSDTLEGGSGNDSLFGGAGRDRLSGGLGNDGLDGGDGNDTLIGGAGESTLNGGAGADGFVFLGPDALAGTARITDFGPGDRLAFDDRYFGAGDAGIDIRGVTEAQAATALRSGAFNYQRGSGEVRVDIDGRGGEDPVIVAILSPGMQLTLEDVVLF